MILTHLPNAMSQSYWLATILTNRKRLANSLSLLLGNSSSLYGMTWETSLPLSRSQRDTCHNAHTLASLAQDIRLASLLSASNSILGCM